MPPFLMGESHGDARMGLARIFGLCAALLFASSVNAANIIDLGPSDYRSYGTGSASHTGAGVRSSFGQTVRMPPTLGTLNVTRNAVIPYGSIANGLRNFTRINPASVAASAAVTGLFLAVDWVFDEASGEWVVEGEDEIEDIEFGLWRANGGSCDGFTGPSAEAVCQATTTCVFGPEMNPTHASVLIQSDTQAQCMVDMPYYPTTASHNITRIAECPTGSTYSSAVGACVIEGEYIPVGESEFRDLENYLPNAPANSVATAAADTQRRIGNPLPGYSDSTITGPSSISGPETTSTSTDPVTGDTTVTTTSTQTNISYGSETITTTTTTTSTSYQNGQETSTTVTTETPGELPVSSGGGEPGEWPGFCDWATVVCDWLDWTQEDPPPEEDLPPVIDDDFYTERDISFGSKSCPEPYQVNLAPFMDTQVSVSFQPLCDFAGLIYYMVMAASYIIAAYISIGVARA